MGEFVARVERSETREIAEMQSVPGFTSFKPGYATQ
jgi:hypothetical protein